MAYVSLFGYTRFQTLNAVLAILGFFSIAVAAFNMLPIPRLDGAIAWGIIPETFKRIRGEIVSHVLQSIELYKPLK